MRTLLLPLLAGCISSQPHAPFSFGMGTQAYWLEAESNNRKEGNAMMILAEGAEMDCDSLEKALGEEVGDALETGHGLIFGLNYNGYGEEGALPEQDFDGFWTSDSSASGKDWAVNRNMYVAAFYDGYVYQNYGLYYGLGSNPLWMKIEQMDGKLVKGTFSADLWAGPFSAKDCGTWKDAGENDDTAWDTR